MTYKTRQEVLRAAADWMEDYDRLARLCEAKDAEIAMQAEALKAVIAVADRATQEFDAAKQAISATAETVAAFRAKETEPLRREVAWLIKGYSEILECEYGEGIDSICNNVLKANTQATALAYEREVKAKALEELLDEADDSNWRSASYSRIEELRAANKGEVK